MKLNDKISFPEVLTSSLDIDGCNYRWGVRRILNLRQVEIYDRNLNFGAAFAEALYLARKGYYIEQLSKHEAEELAEEYVDDVFSVEFTKAMIQRKKEGKPEEKIKTPDRLQNLLKLYFLRFNFTQETIAPFLLNDSFSAEQALYIPFTEVTRLAVKPDMIAIKANGLSSRILDEKTVGNKAQETKFPEYVYMLRPQFNFYAKTLQILQETGELDIPPIDEFEVRRAIINPSVSMANDYCHPINFKLDSKVTDHVFYSFKNGILSLEKQFGKLMEAFDSSIHPYELVKPETELFANFFERNYEMCYQYGKPCALIEHCAVGRTLNYLGFRPSKVNTVTKEIIFED